MKRNWIVAGIMLLVCVGGVLAGLISEQRVLAGLQGVHVLFEDLSPGAKEAGLTKEQIQTDVELKLRLAGIKVLSKEEVLATKSLPCLGVTVTVVRAHERPIPICGYAISVFLCERVILIRDPNTSASVKTWDDGRIGVASRRVLREVIQEDIKDSVDAFINDYLAVNPRQPAGLSGNFLDERQGDK